MITKCGFEKNLFIYSNKLGFNKTEIKSTIIPMLINAREKYIPEITITHEIK